MLTVLHGPERGRHRPALVGSHASAPNCSAVHSICDAKLRIPPVEFRAVISDCTKHKNTVTAIELKPIAPDLH